MAMATGTTTGMVEDTGTITDMGTATITIITRSRLTKRCRRST
jgi:hypothetical protein